MGTIKFDGFNKAVICEYSRLAKPFAEKLITEYTAHLTSMSSLKLNWVQKLLICYRNGIYREKQFWEEHTITRDNLL